MPNRPYQNATFLNAITDHRPSDSYAAGQIGSVVTVKDPADSGVAKRVQIVQYDSVQTLAPADGSVAWWVDRKKYLVSVDTGAALGRGHRAGIIRSAALINEICCVQQGGRCSVLFVNAPTSAPTAAGLIVIPSATSGAADCLAAGSAATYPILGYSLSVAAANFADVMLDIEPNNP